MNYNTFIHAVAGVNEVLHKQAAMQKAAGPRLDAIRKALGGYGASMGSAPWYMDPRLHMGAGGAALGGGLGYLAGGGAGAGIGGALGGLAGVGGAYGLRALNPAAAGGALGPLGSSPANPIQYSELPMQYNPAAGPKLPNGQPNPYYYSPSPVGPGQYYTRNGIPGYTFPKDTGPVTYKKGQNPMVDMINEMGAATSKKK